MKSDSLSLQRWQHIKQIKAAARIECGDDVYDIIASGPEGMQLTKDVSDNTVIKAFNPQGHKTPGYVTRVCLPDQFLNHGGGIKPHRTNGIQVLVYDHDSKGNEAEHLVRVDCKTLAFTQDGGAFKESKYHHTPYTLAARKFLKQKFPMFETNFEIINGNFKKLEVHEPTIEAAPPRDNVPSKTESAIEFLLGSRLQVVDQSAAQTSSSPSKQADFSKVKDAIQKNEVLRFANSFGELLCSPTHLNSLLTLMTTPRPRIVGTSSKASEILPKSRIPAVIGQLKQNELTVNEIVKFWADDRFPQLTAELHKSACQRVHSLNCKLREGMHPLASNFKLREGEKNEINGEGNVIGTSKSFKLEAIQ